MTSKAFETEYKKLNPSQRQAVDTIDGPVMVVAGPGTGKTQILALRIGNILLKTQIKADSILCLTFTNSAVKAMRERLRKYIGVEASKVKISTFHGFGMEILDNYYSVLGLDEKPQLMDEKDTIVLYDEILHKNNWTYLRPRSNSSRYFRDLKSLISLLKRENIGPEDFENKTKKEIQDIEQDPDSVSSRGASKGKLKKEVERKIEGLHRTLEAVKFYSLYEAEKKERNMFDYDDILESLNQIVQESEEVRSYIKESFLYVLVDEHQDSSGVQNAFLEKIWSKQEKPDIFVVGDDRQLIYGFGGASLEYFENFKDTFGQAKLITLVENYRSTQKILDSAHSLLESKITKGKLKSQTNKVKGKLRLIETYYPRDEIIFSVLEIKEKIKQGHDVNDMAILVPKNTQVRSTMEVLKDMDIPFAGGDKVNLFDIREAMSFINVLKIMANPTNGIALGKSFFDKLSGVPPIKAYEFIKNNKMGDFSLVNVIEEKNNLFDKDKSVNIWLGKLKLWLSFSTESLYSFIQKVGTEFLLNTTKNHKELVLRIEVLRTLLHLVLFQTEKNPKLNLADFLDFIDRVEDYGEVIPLSIFSPNDGVKVLTLHGSKGLEFDYVWIAHMDEKSFSGGRGRGFSLPEFIKHKAEDRDEEVLKRQLYVAITRAKRFCTISYALKSYTGRDQELAHIVSDIEDNFEKQNADEIEKIILKTDSRAYVMRTAKDERNDEANTNLKDLVRLVKKDYENRKVSVSLLNNFFECPWKWYFRNLLQLPEPKSGSLEFGSTIHRAIDEILKTKNTITDKEIKKIVGADPGALKVVSRWVKNRLPEINKKRKTEQSISAKDDNFSHFNIYGRIDLIENLNPDNVRVTDFKTGNVRKKSEIEKIDKEGRMSGYLRQLAMYSYLIKQSPKWNAEVSQSRLEFVEAKKDAESFYDTVIGDEQVNLIIKDISDYDKMVKDGQWVRRVCNYNSYGKNTECEYCKMSLIYK